MIGNNSTSTNSTGIEHVFPTILNVISFITYLIGLLANSLIIIVYWRAPKIRDTTMKFILNLAVADFCTLTVMCFYEISLFLDLQFRYKSFLGCIVIDLFVNCFTFSSQFCISSATFDRFVAICYCSRYQGIMSKRMVRILLIGSWITAVILAGFPLYADRNNFPTYNCVYHLILPDAIYLIYSSTLIVLMFLSLSFQVRILIKAWEIYHKTTSHSEVSAAKRKAILNGKLMGIFTFMFIMCWLPYNIVQLHFGSRGKNLNDYILSITLYCGLLNSIFNPFMFAKQRRDFRNETKKLISRIVCCKQNTKLQSQRKDKVDSTERKTSNDNTSTHTSETTLTLSQLRQASNFSLLQIQK